MKKILITGGTGFVGKQLTRFLLKQGYQVGILSRQQLSSTKEVKFYQWNIAKEYIDKKALANVDTIINLAGANIGKKRWTTDRKREIVESRLKSLDLLYKYVSENDFPVKRIISSSAVGYYGTVTNQHIYTENDENGNDFLASVCSQWESAARQFEELEIDVVILRKGVVIGKKGEFSEKIIPLVKRSISPAVGNGKQYIPWIDIRDLVSLYGFLLTNPNISGIFNTVATKQPTMNNMTKAYQNHFNKKSILPNAPAIVIKLLYGKMANMLLYGSRVSNEKIKDCGFQFEYDSIEKALRCSKGVGEI